MAEILFVSLIHIIQNPEQYADKPVRVVGVASVKFEVTGLYVSEQDMRNAVTKNALWIDVASNEETRKLNGKYVIVEGTFDAKRKGHLGMWSGTIRDVTRFELWSDPAAKPAAEPVK